MHDSQHNNTKIKLCELHAQHMQVLHEWAVYTDAVGCVKI